MDDVTLARALHVLGVIHWIGGLAFVTLVVLPAARARSTAKEALDLFASVERRFSSQVRISVPLVGVTGIWMAYRLDLWSRFLDPAFWHLPAMAGIWLLFMLMLFVVEPLTEKRLEARALRDREGVFGGVAALHVILLAFAALTAFGAVCGAHGLLLF